MCYLWYICSNYIYMNFNKKITFSPTKAKDAKAPHIACNRKGKPRVIGGRKATIPLFDQWEVGLPKCRQGNSTFYLPAE